MSGYVETKTYKNILDAIRLATDLTKCNLPHNSSIVCIDFTVLSKLELFNFILVGIITIRVKGMTENIIKAPISHNAEPPKYQTIHADTVDISTSVACITDALL